MDRLIKLLCSVLEINDNLVQFFLLYSPLTLTITFFEPNLLAIIEALI